MESEISMINLIATVILAAITGWYAYTTARMLGEMQKQARLIQRQTRLLAISVAAGVETGIMQMPPPNQYSALHKDTLERLKWIREQMDPLLKEVNAEP